MKQNLRVSLLSLCFVFLLLSYITSARVLAPELQQGDQNNKLKVANEWKLLDGFYGNDEDISKLMGLHLICTGSEGEECTPERKLLAEAHLDYIYTQNHPRP